MATKRGLFIVVEGLDKAGKSTQCARLVANLERHGHKVCAMRFPGCTTL
jgi:dTMP kinase